MIKECLVCDKEFDGTNRQKYCSRTCLNTSKNRKRVGIPIRNELSLKRSCFECGKTFSGYRACLKFCSFKCQKEFHCKKKLADIQIIREKIFSVYGASCKCCGESNIEFLTFDHVNGSGNKHRKEKSTKEILQEILDSHGDGRYRVLCMNCNWAMRFGNTCPHKKISYAAIKEANRQANEEIPDYVFAS